MKKIRSDKPIGVIVHNKLVICKYHKKPPYVAAFISNKQKCHFFFLCEIRQQEGKNRYWWKRYQEEGEVVGKVVGE
jgi:hypothetical protein